MLFVKCVLPHQSIYVLPNKKSHVNILYTKWDQGPKVQKKNLNRRQACLFLKKGDKNRGTCKIGDQK
jgi:hypothetical protein